MNKGMKNGELEEISKCAKTKIGLQGMHKND